MQAHTDRKKNGEYFDKIFLIQQLSSVFHVFSSNQTSIKYTKLLSCIFLTMGSKKAEMDKQDKHHIWFQEPPELAHEKKDA